MPLNAGSRLGAYEITATLGAGGMGEVYRARDTRLNRDVALKVLPEAFLLDADRLARFEREAQVLASLNHPNIGTIYGVEEGPGEAGHPVRALVLELVEGPTLAERIAQGPIPLDEALPIARQIADALEAAHEQGIIHRDLKPANVKLRPDGTVKVLDFGLAKLNESGFGSRGSDDRLRSESPTITSPAMTLAGVILGTAAYMSPEQAKGRAADRRSDVWAFGCVLYEMVSGDQLFKGETVADTLASVLKERPDWERVAPTLRRLLRACLETDPKRRLSAIGDWQLLLDEMGGVVASRSHSGFWAGIAAALFLVLVALIAFLASREPAADAHAFQYSTSPPDNRSVHSFAISPDARYLVVAAGTAGRRELWLRALDTLQWQVLPATDGAAFPFWSPDGGHIAFFSEGALKKITTIGGSPQKLCTCEGRQGTWSRDDVILIASIDGTIRRVPATGGIPSDPLKAGARSVQMLPDGKRFLYGANPQPSLSPIADVHLASLTDNEDRVIVTKVSSFALGASHLLFTRENTLMAQAFDVSSGQTAGEPFPVADGVATSPRGPYTAVAASRNDVIVHVSSEGSEASQIIWVDRSGRPLGSSSISGRMPSVSPDAKTVAYARRATSNSWNVWLRDVMRGSDLTLSASPRSNNAPFWSPAGDRLVYRSAPADASELGLGDLYWADSSGGTPEALLTGPTNKIPTQWSKDGQWIVYTANDPRTAWDVWVVPAGGSPDRKPIPIVQSDAYDFQGQLSPDSRWMAYASDESGQREVYVRPFPSGPGRWKLSIDGGSQPRWRGDGAEIYFAAAAGKMMAVSVKATLGPRPTFEAGVPTPLFDTRLYDGALAYEYDVTADGQRFVVNTNVAGAYATPLTVVVNWTAPLKK